MNLKIIFLVSFFLVIHCASYDQAVKEAKYPGDEWNNIGKSIQKNIRSFDKKLDDTLVPGLKSNDINFDWQNTEEYKMIEIMDRCLVNDDGFICNPYYKKALRYKKIISNKVKRSFYNKNW